MTDYSDLVDDAFRVLEGNSNGSTPYDELILEIEEDAVTLSTMTRYGGDGVTMDVWNGRTRQFFLAEGACVLDLDKLRADMKDGGKLAVLIDRIKAGLSVDWDGSNMKGRLTEDARDASDELGSLVDGRNRYVDDQWSVWDESDWIADLASSTITAHSTDEEIDAFLAEYRATAESDCVVLQGDARDWLIEKRDDLKADLED